MITTWLTILVMLGTASASLQPTTDVSPPARQCRVCSDNFFRRRIIKHRYDSQGLFTFEDDEILLRHNFSWPKCSKQYSIETSQKCFHLAMYGGYKISAGHVVNMYGSLDAVRSIKQNWTHLTPIGSRTFYNFSGEHRTHYNFHLCEEPNCFLKTRSKSTITVSTTTMPTQEVEITKDWTIFCIVSGIIAALRSLVALVFGRLVYKECGKNQSNGTAMGHNEEMGDYSTERSLHPSDE